MEAVSTVTNKAEQILSAEAIYSVFHNGYPINIRTINKLSKKYKKVSFSNSGHAFNLAERLNSIFGVSDFQVVKLTKGEIVIEK